MGETMLQLDTSCHQVKPLVPSAIDQRVPQTPKHHRLFARLLAVDYSSQTQSKAILLKTPLTYVIKHGDLRWCPTRGFISNGQCSYCSKVLYMLLEKISNHQLHAVTNTVNYNSDLSVRYVQAIVAQGCGSNQPLFFQNEKFFHIC